MSVPPGGIVGEFYHLYEIDGTIMLYEDGDSMLLETSGTARWFTTADPTGTWAPETAPTSGPWTKVDEV